MVSMWRKFEIISQRNSFKEGNIFLDHPLFSKIKSSFNYKGLIHTANSPCEYNWMQIRPYALKVPEDQTVSEDYNTPIPFPNGRISSGHCILHPGCDTKQYSVVIAPFAES